MRIASNILPATGPVSAGGDQGRDFETYHTYLRETSLRDSTYLARVADGVVVFAASVEAKPEKSKILDDVKTILAGNIKPERIYFFSPHNVPVAARHRLQRKVLERYQVALEIWDLQAIAVHLSDRDTFWIAEQYLDVPSHLYPRQSTEQEQWFLLFCSEWKDREPGRSRVSEFQVLRRALRFASRSEEHVSNVAWIQQKIAKFQAPDNGRWLRLKSTYELIVAPLYSRGSLEGSEPRIHEYFEEVLQTGAVWPLEDATTLLFFCVGAAARQVVNLNNEELSRWHSDLSALVERLLVNPKSTADECSLLERKGSLLLLTIEDTLEANVDAALHTWETMVVLLPKSPLYPLESFAEFITSAVLLLGQHPAFRKLARDVDDLLATRVGDAYAAENARRRALAWFSENKLVAAIKELHRAKVKWFAEETLEQSMLSMLLISQCYMRLNLSYAAKQYAMAAAFLAVTTDEYRVAGRMPRAAMMIADCDYHAGNWRSFLGSIPFVATAIAKLGPTDPEDQFDSMKELIYYLTLVLYFCEVFNAPDLASGAREGLRLLDAAEAEQELLPTARTTWPSEASLWDSIQRDLSGRPFSDVTRARRVVFSVSGLRWSVSFNNDRNVAAAEEFVALVQVVMADLSDIDLVLMKTRIDVHLEVAEIDEPRADAMASNDGRVWRVLVPVTSSSKPEIQAHFIAVVVQMLREASLVPDAEFGVLLDSVLADGLSAKTFVVRPFRDLYREFHSRFQGTDFRADTPAHHLDYAASESKELAWIESDGPGYERDDALKAITRRYEGSLVPVRYTVRRLASDATFCADLERLIADGWKEWHVLMAIAGIGIGARGNPIDLRRLSTDDVRKQAMRQMTEPESESWPVLDTALFSYDALLRQIRLNMLSSLRGMGLVLYQNTPDFPAIEDLLVVRYHYKQDDTEHEAVFSGCT